jgi:hypothetical protein
MLSEHLLWLSLAFIRSMDRQIVGASVILNTLRCKQTNKHAQSARLGVKLSAMRFAESLPD